MIFDELRKIVGEKYVLLSDEEKAYAERDQSTNVKPSLPLAVVKVKSQNELIDVVRLCLKKKTPIVMRGAGTGKSGGAIADEKGIVIDISLLNRIISIDPVNMFAEVEPGVVLNDLKEEVIKKGLYYPPDPASWKQCTIGGNVAENAAGPSTVKYGTTREYLLGGRAIIGTGEVIDFGKLCPKGVTGYDIASLLCGSEGTLAVFTMLRLRLLPLPKSRALGMFFFDNDEKAILAVNEVFKSGHVPKTLEYVDSTCTKALNKLGYSELKANASMLIIECDASFDNGADLQIHDIKNSLESYGLLDVKLLGSHDEQAGLWDMRSRLSEACSDFLGFKVSEDIAVPLGRLKDLQKAASFLSLPPHIICALFGHAGDGNLHVQLMFDDPVHLSQVLKIRFEILKVVLELGGTLAAEHGIGLQKKAYLPLEQSDALIDLQRRIKRAFDPHNLLNPGKIFDV